MDRGPLIFLGVFLTIASSWLGLVFAPYVQLEDLPPAQSESGDVYPVPLQGEALRGREVYKANGCIYCHSQQVRPANFAADVRQGWGRRTVPRDYLYDRPVMLGTMRTGPDLTNIGKRTPGISGQIYHHKHLYDPRFTASWSIMPSFAFLYEWEKVEGQASSDPVLVELEKFEQWPKRPGYRLVPTADAIALVAYLQALDRTFDLPEAEDP